MEDFGHETTSFGNQRIFVVGVVIVVVVVVANPRIVESGLWILVAVVVVVVERMTMTTMTCLFEVVAETKWRDVSIEYLCCCCCWWCCCLP